MSRLIVKNLPKKAPAANLKELFSSVGTITEFSHKKGRAFAFIGYHSEKDCETAIKTFNGTYFTTNKLEVQLCRPLQKNKENVKDLSESNSDTNKNAQKEKVGENELLEKYKNDPMFEEFLEVHDSSKAEKLKKLKNDDAKEIKEEHPRENREPIKTETTNDQTKKNKDLKLFTVKLRNLPWHYSKKNIKDFFHPLKCFSIRMKPRIHRLAFVGFRTEEMQQRALLKDKSFMNGQRIKVTKEKLKDKTDNKTIENKKWKSQEESLKQTESIAESGKIFVRNLAYTVTEDDLEKLFLKYGPVSEVDLPIDSNTRQMKGFGTITFLMPEHAVKAYNELDGTDFQGRLLHLMPAKNTDKPDEQEESGNYKAKKQKELKAKAGKYYNWNGLFVDSNAVAEVIAERYSTSKEALIGPQGKGSAPVKLALAETQIVTETKNYLEQMGVKLDAFDRNNKKRSKTVILVKNLPSKTVINELRELFEKYGQLGRIILPPSGLTAIIEFLESSEARKAFLNLAYTKFKDMPLYLEWAPLGSLEGNDVENDGEQNNSVKTPESTEVKKEPENNAVPDKKDSESKKIVAELGTTLFVKNLNPATTSSDLKQYFESCGPVLYAKINVKRSGQKTENVGTGFVRYVKKVSAEKALNDLQEGLLDGNNLSIVKSDRIEKGDLANNSTENTDLDVDNQSHKILVKNVPFEATQKELQEIFMTFGSLKSVRLPKSWRAGGSHRGFGFIEFTSYKDAKVAFEALSQSTHLLGRRLVLEWAKLDDDTEDTRKRTVKHYWDEHKAKRSKKAVFNIN